MLGVKTFSILNKLPYFNIISALVGDSLHCVDQGATEHLAELWFCSSNSKKGWYIGKPPKIIQIDAVLLFARPPSNLTRLYCSFAQRSYWKGSDWRNWMFYYGPLALRDILPDRYYSNFLLYSEAIYTLKKKTKFCEVLESIEQLEKCVEDFERLYGIMNMTFNTNTNCCI